MNTCEHASEGIKFSILIPTKDRLDLLKNAVYSVLNQTYGNWELIIADNCSCDDVEKYIASLHEERIIYYRQSEPVSVTDNWNTANDRASGDYIIMLGDDDALVPAALDMLRDRIADGYPQVISFMVYQYLQPDVDPKKMQGDVELAVPFQFSDFTKASVLSQDWRQSTVDKCFAFEQSIGYNMQFYCYSREMVEIVEKYGKFYEPPYPDYYTTCMCMLLADTFVYLSKVIAIMGITPKSYGFYYRNNIEKKGMEFHKEADYRMNAPEAVRGKLCSVDEMDTAAFVTFAQAAERTGRSSVSLEGYYRSVIKRQSQYMDLEMILDLIGKEMAPYVSGEVQAALMEYAHLCIENGKENQTEKDEKECIRMDSIVEVLDSLGELDRRIIRGSFEEYPDIWEWLERIDLSRLKECAGKRSIRIWGAYKRSEYLKMKLEQAGFTVSGFIDKAYAQKEFCGKEVIGPADALDARKREYIMIPLIREYEEILAWLNQYKYEPAKDFLYFGREGKEEIRHE